MLKVAPKKQPWIMHYSELNMFISLR